MTSVEVSAALRAKGFGPADGGRGAQFVNEGGKPHQAGSTTVTVSYLPGYKNGPPEQAQSLVSRLTHSSRSASESEKVNEQIFTTRSWRNMANRTSVAAKYAVLIVAHGYASSTAGMRHSIGRETSHGPPLV